MPVGAPASDVQKNFGTYHDRALAGEAVRVAKYGRETVYIAPAKTYHGLKQGQRQFIAGANLSDTEMALIAAARIPLEERYSADDEQL